MRENRGWSAPSEKLAVGIAAKAVMVRQQLLLGLFTAGLLAVLVFLVPQARGIFEQQGMELPAPTIYVLQLSQLVSAWWWAVAVLFGAQLAWALTTPHRRLAGWVTWSETLVVGLAWPLSAVALLLPFLKL